MKNQAGFLVFVTSFLCEIMLTNLVACKAAFYTSYITSKVNSTIRSCFFMVQSLDRIDVIFCPNYTCNSAVFRRKIYKTFFRTIEARTSLCTTNDKHDNMKRIRNENFFIKLCCFPMARIARCQQAIPDCLTDCPDPVILPSAKAVESLNEQQS